MSIKDVIKKSVLESEMYNQAISLSTILTMTADLLLAFVMGLLIYAVYKKFYKGVVFSRNYAITLVGMTVLKRIVTLAISTNIVISLGMVDCALSYSDKGAACPHVYVLGDNNRNHDRSQHVHIGGNCVCHNDSSYLMLQPPWSGRVSVYACCALCR